MKLTAQSLARQFCNGLYINAVDAGLWRETFAYLAAGSDDTIFQKTRIQSLWAIYGGDLRSRIRDDALILQVLRKALPGDSGEGITLYRGESWFLFDQHQIGFCWTPFEEAATTYAKGLNAVESGGVLLKCYAPPEAILAAPLHPGSPQENVWICDPTRLLRLTTLALFPKP